MKNVNRYIFLLILYLSWHIAQSQSQAYIDSLQKLLPKAKHDTIRCTILKDLAWEYQYYNPDTSIQLGKKAYAAALRAGWEKGKGSALHELSWYYYLIGDFNTALSYCEKAGRVYDNMIRSKNPTIKQHGQGGKGNVLSNYASIYLAQGNAPAALEKYFQVLRINESLGNKKNIALAYLNLGSVFGVLDKIDKAKIYYEKSLKIAEAINDKALVASVVGSLGGIDLEYKRYDKAIILFTRGYVLMTEIGEYNTAASFLLNIGTAYLRMKNAEKAIEYLNKAMEVFKPMNDKMNVASIYENLGEANLLLKKHRVAEIYLQKGIALADSLNALHLLQKIEQKFTKLYDELGEPKLALDHYKKYIQYRDSLTSTENIKKETQAEMQYDFDKKQIADSIKSAEQSYLAKIKYTNEIKQQKMYTIGVVVLFILMLIVAFVSFRAFRNKKKDNLLIEQQKSLVEQKQKEILDSIHYAKRIQQALLPNEKYIYKKINRK